MNRRLKRVLCLALAAALLAGVTQVQRGLNRDRDRLGLTRVQPLENAPPMLAFTTVALGGFRGLIANALWIRATELQDQDKFFEMAQLADWITKLEPHFVQVWLVQSWNLAYNISVKFKENGPGDFSDRWRWVYRGIKLLRDDGLRYNPNEVLIYRELAWFFQHKMGQNLDDGNIYYKQQWLIEMARVFGKTNQPNLDVLITPQTDDERQRAALLRNEFKMDPAFMKEVDERHGPLEWRLPESHAIYWASAGMEKAKLNPSKINADDLIQLRRTVYQSMHMAVQRGKLIADPYNKSFEFGPNIDVIPKANAAYVQAMADDEKMREHIKQAHRNFLRESIYALYLHNRVADAAKWYQVLATEYPQKPIIDGDPNSLPARVTLQEFALASIQVDIKEVMDQKKVQSLLEGFTKRAYMAMLMGEDDLANGWRLMTREIRAGYNKNIKDREFALPVSAIADAEKKVSDEMLDPEKGLPFEMRAVLRGKLGLAPEAAGLTNTPPAGTAPPPPQP